MAQRRTSRNAPAPPPACMSAGVPIDCATGEELPPEAIAPESITVPPEDNYNTIIVGVVHNDDTLIRPIPPNLPLDTSRFTLQQFNDSRVSALHNRVGELINESVRNTPRPFGTGRNARLVAEIEYRLDMLADGANPNRLIDRYWFLFYEDRTIVYVKPMRNLHVITYTILFRQA